jgi:hypothetical protein
MKEQRRLVAVNRNWAVHWVKLVIVTGVGVLVLSPAAHSQSNLRKPVDTSLAAPANHASYTIGYRRLSSQWGGARNQVVPGIFDMDFRPVSWPVSIAVRLAFGYSNTFPKEADPASSFSGSYDIDFGLRKVWTHSKRIQPFVGGGVAVVGASTTIDFGDGTYYQNWWSTAVGPFVDAGCYVPIGEKWYTGVLLSYTKGAGDLYGQKIEMGGPQVAFLIGRRWGKQHGWSN